MPPKFNPLKLNPLQLRTLALLQELARHPELSTHDPETGETFLSQIPQPHGDHFHIGHKLVASRLLPQITEVLGPPVMTPEMVKHACYADAKRLCAKDLGDDEKRHACMQEHRSELSKDCLHAIAASRQH